jgi:hypothetical protein
MGCVVALMRAKETEMRQSELVATGFTAFVICFGVLLWVMSLDRPAPRSGDSGYRDKQKATNDQAEARASNGGASAAQGAGQAPQTANNQGPSNNKPSKDWGNYAEISTAVIAFLAVIIAAVQAWFFYTQLDLMKDALDHAAKNAQGAVDAAVAAKQAVGLAEKTAKKQLRAYLSIEIVASPVFADREIVFHFIPINHGPTPARQFAFRGYTRVMPIADFHSTHFPPPNDKEHLWNTERMDVFPSSTKQANQTIASHTSVQYPASMFELIDSGALALVTFLQIRYVDAFDETQTTQACYRILREVNLEKNQMNVTFQTVPGTSRMT